MKNPIKISRLASLYLALSLAALSSADAATRADFYARFNPAAGDLPFPTNLLFSSSTDGTLNIPVADPTNLADPRVAMNGLDGFSTVAPLTAQFSGSLNADTVKAGGAVRVFEVVLTNPFLDPKNPPFAITAVQRELKAGSDYEVTLSPQDTNQTTLTISPLLPLAPKTGYLVVLTDGIQDSSGYNALPSPTYALTKLPTSLIDDTGQSVIPGLSNAQAQALEPLRQLVNNQESAAASQGLTKGGIVLSWTFMTQSIDDAFAALGKDLKPLGMGVKATGLTTAALPSVNLPGFSDIYAGVLAIPYYLSKDKPLSGYWQTASGGAVTRYNPLPTATAVLQIPVLMTVPNARSGQSKPATGWPVVIYQHGWFRDRTELAFFADALSFAGFAAVAIDMPLHGVTDTTNPFYMRGLERTFDLDLVNNDTGAAGPDGQIDAPSGAYFFNPKSLLTTRDNFREAAEDLRQLTATLPMVDLDGDGKPDLDTGHIHFVGHSMGAITGCTFLAIEDNVTSATLGMAAGGLAKALEGSPKYGPVFAAQLATQGLIKGTPTYENYFVGLQTVADSGDPINYGATAADLHPIHLIEVVGGDGVLPDQNVPNSVENAPLAGTEPLARIMGLRSINRSVWDDKGLRAIVRFTQGDHYSFWYPVASVGATAEMQGQMIDFLHSEGTELGIIYTPVVQ